MTEWLDWFKKYVIKNNSIPIVRDSEGAVRLYYEYGPCDERHHEDGRRYWLTSMKGWE